MIPDVTRNPRLVLNVQPDWTVGLVIAHALEGLPGYDGATLADLEGLTSPSRHGTLVIPEADDPIEGVRTLLAEMLPGHTLTKDAGGSLRVQPTGPGRPAEINDPKPHDAEVNADGSA